MTAVFASRLENWPGRHCTSDKVGVLLFIFTVVHPSFALIWLRDAVTERNGATPNVATKCDSSDPHVRLVRIFDIIIELPWAALLILRGKENTNCKASAAFLRIPGSLLGKRPAELFEPRRNYFGCDCNV